jgi:son of sevenless-like protein
MLLGIDGEVKGGTLPALVSRLYSDESNAPYVAVFMHTFRAFVDSERLLKILQASYGALVPTPDDSEPVKLEKKRYRLRVGNAIKKLVEEVHDDGTNKALTDDLVTQFLDRVMFPVDETLALTIKLKFHQRRSFVESPNSVQQQFSEPAPKPLLPRTGTRASFLTVDALELARQMSLIDSELLRRIGPFELLGGAWAKENKETNSANLLAMIASFNARSTLVVASIVAETQLKQRAVLLRKMIAVASECRALNNFHATFALVAGLNSAPVHRLQKTWAQLSDRERAAFAALGELVSSAKSFKQYRDTLHTVNPPCVPYIGVYQTDLIFIDQGNPDTLNDGRLINFDKCRRTAAVIRELVMYQLPYNLVPVASIQNFLTTAAETADDKALFAASLEIEPRQ